MAGETHDEAPSGAPRPSAADEPLALAYLTSQYPTLSMTFVLREVLRLRRAGHRIDTASINRTDRSGDALTADERAEAALTYYVKPDGLRGALDAHAEALRLDAARYAAGWALAARLAGADVKRFVMNVAYLTEALMVGRWMRSRRQTHLHVHLASQAATVGLFVARVFGHGLSITVHGPDEFFDVRGQYLPEKVAAADFVCCISHFARSQLMRASPYEHWAKLVVCRLGVDVSLFVPPGARPRRETYDVLCVGRLTPAKGQHLLVDAVARIAATGRPMRLVLVGDGVDRGSLERHVERLGAQQLVRLEGAINQDRIRAFYAAADCFCIPSFAEGIPVVLMEAMAMELPCVTTHITGIPELIRNGIDGLLVAPADLDGLVAALCALIDDAALGARLGASARRRVGELFDLDTNVAALIDIFAARVGKRPEPAARSPA